MLQSPSILKTLRQQQQPEAHPPTTNRGVETLTQERIDWISFTLKIDSKRVWPNELDTVSTETKSFNGYDIAKEFQDGRIELTSSSRPEMGIHGVLSGQTCGNLRDVLPDILENVWLQGGHVTRFDLALDDLKGRVNAIDSRAYIQSGKILCRAREYPLAGDVRGGGQTQYCGKMASEVHVCIYDKDVEQGIEGFRTRVEIRFKSHKADKAAKEYLSSNDCRGLILGFVSFPAWPEWNEVFATKPIKVAAEKVASRRIQWLLGQVSKSIALEISERGGDMEILALMRESVMAKLSDIRQAGEEK